MPNRVQGAGWDVQGAWCFQVPGHASTPHATPEAPCTLHLSPRTLHHGAFCAMPEYGL
jgi:hypothetical protein